MATIELGTTPLENFQAAIHCVEDQNIDLSKWNAKLELLTNWLEFNQGERTYVPARIKRKVDDIQAFATFIDLHSRAFPNLGKALEYVNQTLDEISAKCDACDNVED